MPSLRFILMSVFMVAFTYLMCTAPDARGGNATNRFEQSVAVQNLMAKAIGDTPPEMQKQIGDALAKEFARAMHDPAGYYQ